MRVSRERAAENRDRIVDAAGRLFRERGFDGIGVANLMKAAGLTHGGFYGNFESKDDLAMRRAGRAHRDGRDLAGDGRPRSEGAAQGLVEQYLTARHRDRPGRMHLRGARRGCRPAEQPGLASHLHRRSEPLIDTLVRIVPGRSKAARRQKALASLSAMVGALILARAVDDAALSDESSPPSVPRRGSQADGATRLRPQAGPRDVALHERRPPRIALSRGRL